MGCGSPPSDVTGDYGPTNSTESQYTLSQDSLVRESMSTEWTDEKHSLYLKSMEASFVNDLYNSVDTLGWPSQREHSTDPGNKRTNACLSSGQYKVHRDGCWEKVSFERDRPQLGKTDGPRILLTNPWIRHFRSACRQQIVESSNLQANAASGSLEVRVSGKMALIPADLAANLKQLTVFRSSLCRDDLDGSNEEGTDQNFVDEESEGEKANHVSKAKRRRRTSAVTNQ